MAYSGIWRSRGIAAGHRLKNLVVYALQGGYEVEAVDTEAQNRAIEIGHEVRDHGYDVVVAFGGDGTLGHLVKVRCRSDVTDVFP